MGAESYGNNICPVAFSCQNCGKDSISWPFCSDRCRRRHAIKVDCGTASPVPVGLFNVRQDYPPASDRIESLRNEIRWLRYQLKNPVIKARKEQQDETE